MKTVSDIIDIMETFAPTDRAYIMKDDNNGLLVGTSEQAVDTIICALDVTNAVIDEAIERKANLIICHHPLIFLPIRFITDGDILGQKLLRLIQNNIAVYASHTSLDFCFGGINDHFCQQLGLENIEYLDQSGVGRMGELPQPLTLFELRDRVSKAFGDDFAAAVGDGGAMIKKAAVINGGAGDIEYIDLAIKRGADCYISGDFRHHVLLYAHEKKFPLVECSHKAAEEIYIEKLVQIIRDKTNLRVISAQQQKLKQ